MPDGSLRIRTKLDNSGIDKDVQVLENKIKKLQLENSNLVKQQNSLQDTINKYQELTQKVEEYKSKMQSLQYIDKNGMIQVKDNKKMLDLQAMYSIANEELRKQASKIDNVYVRLDKVKAKQTENNAKIQEYTQKIEGAKKKQLELKNSADQIGKSINSGMTKILRYGAALLGIHSIYGLLSNAMNSWLNGNSGAAKQLKSDIDYMKNAVGRALSPVLKYIVNLLYQALGLTGALIKAFTGIDIFAGSVADYMSSTTSSANKTNKELKKQLFSFDKINKLNGNNTNSGGGGIVTPSQDLSNIMNKYSDFAEKVKKTFNEIKDIIPIIGAGILAWKLSDLFFSQLDGLKALKAKVGLTLLITGLAVWYEGVKQFKNGEITGKSLLQVVGGAIGAGIGVGMLTGSVTLGLTLGLVLISVAMIEGGKHTLMGMVASKLGLSESNKTTAYVLAFDFELSAKIFGYDSFVDLLASNMKSILLTVADYIESIPFIGESIANGIRTAIKASENDTANTIKYSTQEALEKANPWVKKASEKTGKEARKAYQSGYNSLTDETSKTIENAQTIALNNASTKVNREAYRKGQEEGQSVNSGIGSESLVEGTNKLLNTGREALNNSTMLSEGKTVGSTIREGYSTNNINVETQTIVNGAKAILNNSSLLTEGNKLSKTIDTGFNQTDFNNTGKNSVNRIAQGMSKETWQIINESKKIAQEANKTASNNMNGYSSGENLISGIKQGINANKSSLFSTIGNVGYKLLSTFKSVLGIHSPSREMASLSKFIPLGIAEGVDSTSDKAIDSMKNLVYGMQDVVDDMDYSNLTQIPKISRNAVTYIPKQAISTNEIQRSIVGQDNSMLNKILSTLQSSSKGKTSVTIPIMVDGEEWFRKTIELNEAYNLATNGGGF